MQRRHFIKNSLLGLGALVGSQLPFSPLLKVLAQKQEEVELNLRSAVTNVHDPVIMKHEDYYYVFCTGVGIPIRRSKDLIKWTIAPRGTVFSSQPEEAFAYVSGATDIWAPDISFYNDKYHIYYSVSTFGSNHSAIGLATNPTLDASDENYEWVDHGIVVKSQGSDFYNTIDANLIIDEEGTPWLAFGSFWGGIKLVELDYETGKTVEGAELHSLATRPIHPRAVEAAFTIFKEGYYYLFVSFDQCCNGISSTYNVRVGRSEAVTGPYVDKEGVPMMEGGGTQVTFPDDRWKGPGHNSILREDDKEWIVYHAYDARNGGTPTLRINPLEWVDGFPQIPSVESE